MTDDPRSDDEKLADVAERADAYEEFSGSDVHQPLGGQAPPAEGGGRPATEAPDDREDDLGRAARQRDEYYDLLLRKSAEFENYRKRIERERREQYDLAAADLLAELLPVLDDFERALETPPGPDGAEAYRRGLELIHRQLFDLLRRRGVRPIAAVGAEFDPHVHQAVAHETSPEHREGEVIEEFRRGYMLGERLLRPSMVKVAKG
jgi:molecular chaperone GrpE